MLQFFIGSLPESYRWFLKLLGLPGSVDGGLRNLRRAATQPNDFQLEARLILALLEETYYKKPAAALSLMETLRRQQPDNLLVSYLLVSQLKKQHRTDEALAAFRARPTGPGYLPLPYLHHMAADLLLYQGQYAASRRENALFLQDYAGQHYRKDAWFKLLPGRLAGWRCGRRRPVPPSHRGRGPHDSGGGQLRPALLRGPTAAQPHSHPGPPANRRRLLPPRPGHPGPVPAHRRHAPARPAGEHLPSRPGPTPARPPRFGPRPLRPDGSPGRRRALLLRAPVRPAAGLPLSGRRPAQHRQSLLPQGPELPQARIQEQHRHQSQAGPGRAGVTQHPRVESLGYVASRASLVVLSHSIAQGFSPGTPRRTTYRRFFPLNSPGFQPWGTGLSAAHPIVLLPRAVRSACPTSPRLPRPRPALGCWLSPLRLLRTQRAALPRRPVPAAVSRRRSGS